MTSKEFPLGATVLARRASAYTEELGAGKHKEFRVREILHHSHNQHTNDQWLESAPTSWDERLEKIETF